MDDPQPPRPARQRSWPWRILRTAVVSVVLTWLLAVCGLWLFQEPLLFPATVGEPRETPDQWGIPFHRHTVATADGAELDVWWMPNNSDDYLLFCHGNAGNLGHRVDTFRSLHLAGLNVLAFDYRGYGRSSGSPSEKGLYADADAVWQFATTTLGIPEERIIVHGRSLGGAVAAYLAQRNPAARGLILESTFTSIPDVAQGHYPIIPVALLARHIFPSAQRLPAIHMPLLVIHGRGDRTIPFRHGETLYQLANEPKTLVILDGGHNDGYVLQGERWLAGITTFLAGL